HCYSGPGTYLVQLDVVNLITQEVLVNQKSEVLEVKDVEQPYISAPDTTIPGEAVKFSAGLTNLPGWNIAQYYWNFGDETIAVGRDVEKVYTTPGTYNVQLIVTTAPDAEGKVRDACVSRNIVISGRR
ncbi:MAG: PKD domain-containing protein, partial [Bacteroidales bacterium]|nr:PKD domain-containing protein [Bacteroidales bacterium]